jgi:hypothetical protein
VGTGAVAHEKVSGHVRPAGMFFHKYWRIDKKGMKIGEKAEFMSNALLADLIRIFKSHLSQLVPDARVTVDWPYESPIMLPSLIVDHYLTGGIEGNKPATIAYETRKDLLVGRSNLNVLLAAIEEMVTSARQFICNR